MRGNPRPIPAVGPPLPNNPLVGTSPQGPGVEGLSNDGDGVFGNGKNGVHGRAGSNGVGVWGENISGGYGVKGSTNSPFVAGEGGTAGVWGDNTGTGTGVKGTSAGGDAVLGYSKASNHAGVAAVNNSGGFGVWARGTPAGHFEGDAGAVGVYGQGGSNSAGVFGIGASGSEYGPGVVGISAFGPNAPVTDPAASGVYGQGWWGVQGVAAAGGEAGIVGWASDENGLAAWFPGGDVQIDGKLRLFGDVVAGQPPLIFQGDQFLEGNLFVNGSLTVASPMKSAVVPFPDGTHRRLYCMESPESWFEDFGTGQLVEGQAQVQLDPGFASVVAADEYHVFLTEYEDNSAVYVTGRTSTGFGVRAKTSSNANGTFSYRVVAKRKDGVAPRFDQVAIPQPRTAERSPHRAPATAPRPTPIPPTP